MYCTCASPGFCFSSIPALVFGQIFLYLDFDFGFVFSVELSLRTFECIWNDSQTLYCPIRLIPVYQTIACDRYFVFGISCIALFCWLSTSLPVTTNFNKLHLSLLLVVIGSLSACLIFRVHVRNVHTSFIYLCTSRQLRFGVKHALGLG